MGVMEPKDFQDLEIDDILQSKDRKPKIDSGDKGKRNERALGKLLKERFGFEFSRSVGSGNRWGQVSFLPPHAQQTFSGDLVTPSNFRFVIECKAGYGTIDFHSIFDDGLAAIQAWIEQAEDESRRCGKEPIIAWKKDRKPWMAFVKKKLIPDPKFAFSLYYNEWIIVSLESLFKLDDAFFFSL